MTDQIYEVFLTQEQSKCINQRMPRGYSLQFSSSHTRRIAMQPNPVKLNQYEQTLIQEKAKATRSKMNQAANNAQQSAQQAPVVPQATVAQNNAATTAPVAATAAKKAEKEKKPQNRKESLNTINNNLVPPPPAPAQKEQITEPIEGGNTKKKKQQEKIKEKETAKNEKNQNQILQQMMNAENQIKGTIPVSEDMKVCFQILQQLKKHQSASPFLQKVDALLQQCPDYYKVIKDPMDLSKVESNLKQGVYQTRNQFANDVKKIWDNSFKYNSQGSQIYKMTEEMSNLFEKLYAQIKNQSVATQPLEYFATQETAGTSSQSLKKQNGKGQKGEGVNSAANSSTAPLSNAVSATAATTTPAQNAKPEKPKKGKAAQAALQQQQPAIDKSQVRLTQDEIGYIYNNVGNLTEDDTKTLCELIKDFCAINNESIELNIDNLPVSKAREVYDFVYTKITQPTQNKIQQQQQLPPQQQQQPQQQQPQSQPLQTQEEAQEPKKKKKLGKLEKKDIPLTISEKKQLGLNIRNLAPEDLNGIWSIVQDSQHNTEVIEFDIDTLPVRKARELEAYVKQRAALQAKKQRVNKMNPQANLAAQQQAQAQIQEQYSLVPLQNNPQQQQQQLGQASMLPQSSSSTATATSTAPTTATSTAAYPNQAGYNAGVVQNQQYPQNDQQQQLQQQQHSLYNQASNYAQQNQIVQNGIGAQNMIQKQNPHQGMIPQVNQAYIQGNANPNQMGQVNPAAMQGQNVTSTPIPNSNNATVPNTATATGAAVVPGNLAPMQPYNPNLNNANNTANPAAATLPPQTYPQQPTYANPMMMQSYTSPFPIQSPIQNPMMGGYQNRGYGNEGQQQGNGMQGMMNGGQAQFQAVQQYGQQGQQQYGGGYPNNVQNMYMNQAMNGNPGNNAVHANRNMPQQMQQYPNAVGQTAVAAGTISATTGASAVVPNGLQQYPTQQPTQNYYTNQPYAANPASYQPSMNAYANTTTTPIHPNTYNPHVVQNHHQQHSEQSSEGMLSESEEE